MTTPEHLRDLADRNDAEAEAWRQFSKTSGRIALHEESATALRTAADEVDRLRAVIENAPHEHYCGLYFVDMDGVQEDNPDGVCDCWKADAL